MDCAGSGFVIQISIACLTVHAIDFTTRNLSLHGYQNMQNQTRAFFFKIMIFPTGEVTVVGRGLGAGNPQSRGGFRKQP